MSHSIWQLLVLVISGGMILLSGYCVLFPRKLVLDMPHLAASRPARNADIVVRLLLGVSLICSAQASSLPAVYIAIGALSLVAAVALLILDNRKIERIVNAIANRLPLWAVGLV